MNNKINLEKNPLQEAIAILRSGGIAIINTDTLYALTCDALNESAIFSIYQLKKRPKEKIMPVFMQDVEHASEYVKFNSDALKLCQSFWPGPLTLVLPLQDDVFIPNSLHSFDNTLAVRVPRNNFILQIITELKRPIIGTSANISGESTLKNIEELQGIFGADVKIFSYNDEVESEVNGPSTIVSFAKGKLNILRHGAISELEIEKAL